VTLEDFNTLQANLGALQSAGLLDPHVKPAPTLSLADLMTVTHMLDTPALLLHYLHRRTHLQGSLEYSGDELELLGCYLHNGLLFGDAETNGTRLTFVGMAFEADRYMTARDENIPLIKPKRKMSRRWMAMLDRLARSQRPRRTEMAIALLDVDVPQQEALERAIKKLMKKQRCRGGDDTSDNVVVCIPAGLALTAVAAVVFTDENAMHRHAVADNAVMMAFRDPRPARCVVIGIRAADARGDYSFLSLATRAGVAPVSPYDH
jgi:hypothetical protein